jgi:hypothetical protein
MSYRARDVGIIGDFTIRDAAGRVPIEYPELVSVGQRVYRCRVEGDPEYQVRVALDEAGAKVGILTGRSRRCRVGRREFARADHAGRRPDRASRFGRR